MFTLKHYDTPLCRFEMYDDTLDGQKARVLWTDETKEQYLPIGLKCTDEGMMKWLRGRTVPKNRAFAQSLLAKNGLNPNDIRGIIRISRGLSLNDCYWIVEDDFDGTFAQYNLYEHDFLKVLSLIAYTGYGSTRVHGFISSPEFTTGGMLRKAWRRDKSSGKIILYKGGTSGAVNAGNEPYSEYYAARIAQKMDLPHVEYGLSMWKKDLCSTCELFTDINYSYVPIHRFVEDYSLRTVSAFLKELGKDYFDAFSDMLIFDALICNEDRHFGNFGLTVDNRTNCPIGFAPIFDNGLSLFNYAMADDLADTKAYAKTRMSAYNVPFENVVREFITPRQKAKLKRMTGFRFTKHKSYNLPASRLKALEEFLGYRVAELLEM